MDNKKNKLNGIYGKNSDITTRNVAKSQAACYLYMMMTTIGFSYCDTDSVYRNDRKEEQ